MKTAMIWGAHGGIGQALTQELMKNDWTVVALSRRADEMESKATHSIEADVADENSVKRAVLMTGQEVGEVDLWVYAAGDIVYSPTAETPPDAWRRVLDANLTGVHLTIHHSLPLLSPNAHIVILGAVSERLRLPGLSAYAAAKAGLEAMAEALRKEQRQRRVTLVRPGAVNTPFWQRVPLRMPKDAAPPDKVAHRITEAYESGHSGLLDLV